MTLGMQWRGGERKVNHLGEGQERKREGEEKRGLERRTGERRMDLVNKIRCGGERMGSEERWMSVRDMEHDEVALWTLI